MIRFLFLDYRFPCWKRVRKSKFLQIGQTSSYKAILIWEIDWKWFRIIGLLFLDHRFPWWKRVQNRNFCKMVENHPINKFWLNPIILVLDPPPEIFVNSVVRGAGGSPTKKPKNAFGGGARVSPRQDEVINNHKTNHKGVCRGYPSENEMKNVNLHTLNSSY